MFGFGCVLRRVWRSNIVVCIPLVLRVRAVMVGWMYFIGDIVSTGIVEVCGVWVVVWEGVVWGGGSCVPCVISWVSRAGSWLGVGAGVVVGGGCVSGDVFQALHCSMCIWVAFFV